MGVFTLGEQVASTGVFTPEMYGAVGDGTINDAVALQAMFDAAAANLGVAVLSPGKVYKTNAQLRFGSGTEWYVRLEGRGATIKAGAVINAVLYVENNILLVRDLFIRCERVADCGIQYISASTSVFDNIDVYQPLKDGFCSLGNSDRCILRNCMARMCGMVYHTSGYAGQGPQNIRTTVSGTVSRTAAIGYTPCVITGDNLSIGFDAMGIRPRDFISMHATSPGTSSAVWMQIDTVDSATQMTCKLLPASPDAASGLQFSIHTGNAYHEGPGRADNGIHRIDTFLAENTAGSGLSFGGLYGDRCTNIQVNAACAYPICVASVDLQCIGSSFHGVYFELCQPVDNFFLGGAAGITIDTGNVVGSPQVSSGGFNWGVLTNMQNLADPGRIDPVETTTASYIPNMVLRQDCQTWGRLKGRSYISYTLPGGGYLEMDDRSVSAPWSAQSGMSWVYGYASVAAFGFDTDNVVNNGVASADLLTKHLSRWKNAGVFKFGVGVEGDIRVTSSDASGTPGDCTIDKPSGRVAIAIGASAVVVTNALVKVGTKVFLSKIDLDATATDFNVVSADGSFTITTNTSATAAVKFDFFLVNASTV